jgi:hypothetical protein
MDKFTQLIKLRKELLESKLPNKKMDIEPNPCWEGYEPIGLKDDGSPNCVPIKEEQRTVKEGFPIPSPSSNEDENTYISKCMEAIVGEYGQEQASAICYSKWNEK